MLPYRNATIWVVVAFLSLFQGCREAGKEITRVDGTLISIDSTTVKEKDPEADSLIALYRAQLEAEMNEVLAYSEQTMEKDSPEGLLNNFVADLILEQGRSLYSPDDGQPIDFCLLNYGGLRASIYEGEVTRARIYELMPFENEMVVITLTPEKTRDLFEYLAEADRGMPVSGIRINIEGGQVNEVTIGGEPFDADRHYKVLTSDYLAGGGDDMTFFLEPVDREMLGKRIRDAIIDYLTAQDQQGNKISSQLDGRIQK
ncbi:MAG: 5'-nucleotidase [Bacteroidales bacterium]